MTRFHDQYVLFLSDVRPMTAPQEIDCGEAVAFNGATERLIYEVTYDENYGSTDINYNITSGTARIIISYDTQVLQSEDITGEGTFNFRREIGSERRIIFTVIPVTDSISFTMTFECSEGVNYRLINVLRTDGNDFGKRTDLRVRWGGTKHRV